ncbi:sensor histidine kinase [Brevibacterium luteolum]|uniref:histidine kinase n=1 Tax=Brevibacterium luteolum TaxID=199591 RepID=A0A2N6PI71_9MICO|nr:sensor histidine kinase [Brevibacterium luteolum]PMB98385.1 sensor histidine kinase [Brevibacterium luteolum]
MNTTPSPDGAREDVTRPTIPLPQGTPSTPPEPATPDPTAVIPTGDENDQNHQADAAAQVDRADETEAATASGTDTAAGTGGTPPAPPAPVPGAAETPAPQPSAAELTERKWRKGYPGFFGIANVIVSGVLAVVWLWLPVVVLIAGLSGLFALGLGLLALFVWFVLQRGINRVERFRAEAVYGDGIASAPTPESAYAPGFSRFMHNQWLVFKSPSFWRSTAHHYIKVIYGGFVCGLAALGLTFAGLLAAAALNPEFLPGQLGDFSRLGSGLIALAAFVSTVLILLLSPYPDRALDRALLPATRTEALRAEVKTLDRARAGAVDAATSERLRIERDLHDGVQPMLVATSMKLGMAKAKMDTDPEAAKALLTEAHAESKAAITELRQLARGIHPAVLSDRGLDAAVSALAARCAVPVRVTVDLLDHSAAQLAGVTGSVPLTKVSSEAVAYFVVAEALTNVSKHSLATEAHVRIYVRDGRLHISVSDNGRGGARVDPVVGSGLAGLADRVTAARGTWALTSPVGGPTTLVVEVPCA